MRSLPLLTIFIQDSWINTEINGMGWQTIISSEGEVKISSYFYCRHVPSVIFCLSFMRDDIATHERHIWLMSFFNSYRCYCIEYVCDQCKQIVLFFVPNSLLIIRVQHRKQTVTMGFTNTPIFHFINYRTDK